LLASIQRVLRLLGRRFGLRVLALASVGEKSGARAKTCVAGPRLILRRHVLMQALLIASCAMSGRAEAACTPASPVNNTIVTCSGRTTNQNGTNGYGTVNDNNNTYNIQAGATVTGDGFGVVFGTGATVNNDGTITGGIGVSGSDATINNTSTGVITGDTNGIQATTATVRNAGLISAMGVSAAGGNGVGISADTADVNNTSTGHITGTFSGIGTSTLATVNNSGAISGGRLGITGDTAGVINSGAITAGSAAIFASTANVTSSGAGTISGGTFGIVANTVASIANDGIILGKTGIQAGGAATITNSSAIISTAGASGTAIKLSNAADTLTLRTGSRIVGLVDMGFGNDTVNTVTVAPDSKVSSPATAAALPTFINFSGVTNTSFTGGRFTDPEVQAGNQLATLDPTALAADRPRLDGLHRRACRRWCKDASMAWRRPRTLRARQGLRHPLALKGSKNDR
jgi:hypothetical protein